MSRDSKPPLPSVREASRRQEEEHRRHARLRSAARQVDFAWDAWMNNDDDEGQDQVARAIGRLRVALRELE